MNEQENLETESGAPIKRRGSGVKATNCKQDFTAGLKQIYDSVVDDPIPAHLMELLAKFDEKADPDENEAK